MLFSIVSINLNNLRGLRLTAQSVLGQDFKDFEYLIIDGQSDDGSQDFAKELAKKDPRVRIVIGKDSGIYDAMNKGLREARGVFLNFMNTGDSFASPYVLSCLVEEVRAGVDVLYGDSICRYSSGLEVLRKTKPLRDFYKGMPFVHQSSFVRTANFAGLGFDLNFKIAADFDLFCKLVVAGSRFNKVDRPIAIYEAGGLSDQKRSLALDEYREISLRSFPHPLLTKVYFWTRQRREQIVSKIKSIFPAESLVRIKHWF